MKILHIIGGNINGGAAKGAINLHKGLLHNKQSSRILTNSSVKTSYNDNSIFYYNSIKYRIIIKIYSFIDKLILFLYPNRANSTFSTSFFGLNITKHPFFEWCDVIHLHWINNEFINIKHLKNINKPIVWTLRDMWPFTGGCHIALTCQNFKNECGNCPYLRSNKHEDLSHIIYNRKKKYYPNSLQIVGISNWISSYAKSSSLFSKSNVTTIFNNIDTEIFYPVDKLLAKKNLNIISNNKIILIGTSDANQDYKGIIPFLNTLQNNINCEYFYIFFGNLDNELIKIKHNKFINFGHINDENLLRTLYSAADVFVSPTLMESFGKTIAEAMACGLPVVCFDATGPQDIIDHKINGYKAEYFNYIDLFNGINWIILNQSTSMSIAARNKIVTEFDIKIIAKKYIHLYKSISL